MTRNSRRYFRNASLALCLVLITACAPSYINQQDLGEKATADEIRNHYSGKSIFAPKTATHPYLLEEYFAADGTYKKISTDDSTQTIRIGTWEAVSPSIGADIIRLISTGYFIKDGKATSHTVTDTFWVYLQPDGSSIVDEVGGGNNWNPKPTPGFQSEREWNAIARRIGI